MENAIHICNNQPLKGMGNTPWTSDVKRHILQPSGRRRICRHPGSLQDPGPAHCLPSMTPQPHQQEFTLRVAPHTESLLPPFYTVSCPEGGHSFSVDHTEICSRLVTCSGIQRTPKKVWAPACWTAVSWPHPTKESHQGRRWLSLTFQDFVFHTWAVSHSMTQRISKETVDSEVKRGLFFLNVSRSHSRNTWILRLISEITSAANSV